MRYFLNSARDNEGTFPLIMARIIHCGDNFGRGIISRDLTRFEIFVGFIGKLSIEMTNMQYDLRNCLFKVCNNPMPQIRLKESRKNSRRQMNTSGDGNVEHI